MKLLIFTACLVTLVYAQSTTDTPIQNETTESSKGAGTTAGSTPVTTSVTTNGAGTTAMGSSTPAKNPTSQSPIISTPKVPSTTSGSSSLTTTMATILVSSAVFLFNRYH